MKLLLKNIGTACLFFASSQAFSQTTLSKQKVFDKYPQSVKLEKSLLQSTFSGKTGSEVSINLASDFIFTGTIISNKMKYDNMQTIIVRAKDNDHSLLQLTKNINADKTVSYVGRIMNSNAADGYELKNTNGSYSLQKILTTKMIEPCNP